MLMPSFSFIDADLAMQQLRIGVRDRALKIGCSCRINLGYLGTNNRHGLTFFIYFFITIKSIILPSFSFIEADLAMREQHIGVHDGTLKLGCSNMI